MCVYIYGILLRNNRRMNRRPMGPWDATYVQAAHVGGSSKVGVLRLYVLFRSSNLWQGLYVPHSVGLRVYEVLLIFIEGCEGWKGSIP